MEKDYRSIDTTCKRDLVLIGEHWDGGLMHSLSELAPFLSKRSGWTGESEKGSAIWGVEGLAVGRAYQVEHRQPQKPTLAFPL